MRHFAIALGLFVVLGCQTGGGQAKSDPDLQKPIAAIIDERTITLSELDDHIKDDLFKRAGGGDEVAIYELRSQYLRNMLNQIALDRAASAEDLPKETVLQQQIDALGPPSESELAPLYEMIDRLQMDPAQLEGLDERIQAAVNIRRTPEAYRNLREKAGTTVYLDPPRIDVEAIGPSKGPDDAAVTIVAFSNFQCEPCQLSEPTIKKVLARYPEQVRLVFRHFPRAGHPRSQPAAEAAVCAGAQGKFWAYHDRLFKKSVGGLSDEDLDGYGIELGLDMERFRQCLFEHESEGLVAADEADAEFLGLVRVPTYFLNGIRITGSRSASVFSEKIDAELDRLALDAAKAPGN